MEFFRRHGSEERVSARLFAGFVAGHLTDERAIVRIRQCQNGKP